MVKVWINRYSWGAGKVGSEYSSWFIRLEAGDCPTLNINAMENYLLSHSLTGLSTPRCLPKSIWVGEAILSLRVSLWHMVCTLYCWCLWSIDLSQLMWNLPDYLVLIWMSSSNQVIWIRVDQKLDHLRKIAGHTFMYKLLVLAITSSLTVQTYWTFWPWDKAQLSSAFPITGKAQKGGLCPTAKKFNTSVLSEKS